MAGLSSVGCVMQFNSWESALKKEFRAVRCPRLDYRRPDEIMTLMLRNETVGDCSQIREVLLDAFPTPAEANLVERLRATDRLAISLAAFEGDDIVGHIAFSPVTVNDRQASGLGLAPVAVVSSRQGRGIGSKLINAGLDACRRVNADFVVVLGEPEYYHRFGFKRASEFGLENEYGVDEPFMAIELTENALTSASGLVKYAPAFGELE